MGRFEWYGRKEGAGWWRVPACPEHGRELRRHRFELLGAQADFRGVGRRTATTCSVCDHPELLPEVESCTCEVDPGRCPVHQNVGCGG